jgi:hypothetical protein
MTGVSSLTNNRPTSAVCRRRPRPPRRSYRLGTATGGLSPLAFLDSCTTTTSLSRPGPFWQCTPGRGGSRDEMRTADWLCALSIQPLSGTGSTQVLKECQVFCGEQVVSHCRGGLVAAGPALLGAPHGLTQASAHLWQKECQVFCGEQVVSHCRGGLVAAGPALLGGPHGLTQVSAHLWQKECQVFCGEQVVSHCRGGLKVRKYQSFPISHHIQCSPCSCWTCTDDF